MPVARLQVNDIDQWVVRTRKTGLGEASIRNQLQTLRSAHCASRAMGMDQSEPGVPREV